MQGLGRGGRARRLFAKNPTKYGVISPSYYKKPRYQKSSRQRLLENGDEVKNLDTVLSIPMITTGACSTSAATGNIHIVPTGDTAVTREGRKITITSISVQGNITFTPGGGATAAEMAYIYLILDRQCNGVNPAITDVFTTNDMEKNQLNLNNSKRFKVMKKWVVRLVPQAGVTGAYNEDIKHIKCFKKVNIPIYYNGDAGTVAQTTQNNIFFAFGVANTIGPVVNLDGTCRIRYVG